MLAIVDIGGKQYKIEKGTKLVVDRLEGKEGDTIKLERVLLVSDGGKTTTGNPTIKGAVVSAKIVAQQQGEKLHVRRYRSKVRHRRHVGFRPQESALEILSIIAK